MLFKLRKPIKSALGASTITEVSIRDMVADDIVEGFSAHDKGAKQIHAMVCRCASILPEEVGKLCPADYLQIQRYVTEQLEGSDTDPKEGTPSS